MLYIFLISVVDSDWIWCQVHFSTGKPADASNSVLSSVLLNYAVRNQMKERESRGKKHQTHVFHKILIRSSKKVNPKVLYCTFRCGTCN